VVIFAVYGTFTSLEPICLVTMKATFSPLTVPPVIGQVFWPWTK
jgi:hypothetical protein